MFTIYILYSEKFNKIYIGYTSDLQKRLLSHNELGTNGWTINFRPWELIYSETFNTKKEAMMKEKFFKSGKGRELIKTIILPEFLSKNK